MILGPLKVRSAPKENGFPHTANIESFDYDIEVWVGEAISKGIKLSNDVIVVE